MEHVLKTWPAYFQAVLDGDKKHEIRVNDRNYQVGDSLRLREWEPSTGAYTGREQRVRVTYLSPGGGWGLPPNICVMSVASVRE